MMFRPHPATVAYKNSLRSYFKESADVPRKSDLEHVLMLIEQAHQEFTSGGDPDQLFSKLEMQVEEMIGGPREVDPRDEDDDAYERAAEEAFDDVHDGGLPRRSFSRRG